MLDYFALHQQELPRCWLLRFWLPRPLCFSGKAGLLHPLHTEGLRFSLSSPAGGVWDLSLWDNRKLSLVVVVTILLHLALSDQRSPVLKFLQCILFRTCRVSSYVSCWEKSGWRFRKSLLGPQENQEPRQESFRSWMWRRSTTKCLECCFLMCFVAVSHREWFSGASSLWNWLIFP